jgi:hypothetical protein
MPDFTGSLTFIGAFLLLYGDFKLFLNCFKEIPVFGF